MPNRHSILAFSASCVSTLLLLVSCAGPQPTTLTGSDELPKDWLALSGNDGKVQSLDPSTQELLATTRKLMEAERRTAEYKSSGDYSQSTKTAMANACRAADSAYLASNAVLQRNLTPELYSTASTKDEANWDWYQVTNQDLRMVGDDWARFWLVDRPSYLSPYPIVNTTGNP
jgi:hypothetical protein